MFGSGIRYAPLEDAWNDSGMIISPKFENPYKTEASVIGDVNKRDVAHKYLIDAYDARGVRGVIDVMQPEMIRDIQSLHKPPNHAHPVVHLSVEDMFLIVIAVLLFMYVSSD